MEAAPITLQEAILFFAKPENCHEFMAKLRWPDGVVKCPRCGSEKVKYLPNAKVFKCFEKHAQQKFSLKVGTVFEDSPIGLDKWLPVMWLIVNAKNGISSWEIHRAMGVTQKTAWFMLQRARLAMQDDLSGGLLGGEVEVDETFIGGKARNMHKDRKRKMQQSGRNLGNKTVVMGMLERKTEAKKARVRTAVIPDTTKKHIRIEVLSNIERGAEIDADEAANRWRVEEDEYAYNIINHLDAYVRGNVHTNTLENFWALLKRGIGGTYIAVEPFHLFRYVDEQAFRYNNRYEMNDGDRFIAVMKQVVGKRLTYKQLTGKEGEIPEAF